MNRSLLFLPFAALVGLSAYFGWQLGQPVSEADVLDFHAARWVETGPPGAQVTDCLGIPGDQQNVWIVVICTAQSGEVRRIQVDRRGRALEQIREPQA